MLLVCKLPINENIQDVFFCMCLPSSNIVVTCLSMPLCGVVVHPSRSWNFPLGVISSSLGDFINSAAVNILVYIFQYIYVHISVEYTFRDKLGWGA